MRCLRDLPWAPLPLCTPIKPRILHKPSNSSSAPTEPLVFGNRNPAGRLLRLYFVYRLANPARRIQIGKNLAARYRSRGVSRVSVANADVSKSLFVLLPQFEVDREDNNSLTAALRELRLLAPDLPTTATIVSDNTLNVQKQWSKMLDRKTRVIATDEYVDALAAFFCGTCARSATCTSANADLTGADVLHLLIAVYDADKALAMASDAYRTHVLERTHDCLTNTFASQIIDGSVLAGGLSSSG